MALISPGSNPGARFAVVVGAGTFLASAPLQHAAPESSFDRNREMSRGPAVDWTHYEKLEVQQRCLEVQQVSRGQLHEPSS